MSLKYIAYSLIAVILTFLIHECTHWVMGELLGYEMIMTLNKAYPAKLSYDKDWHYTLMSAVGPLITLLQALIIYLIIKRTSRRNLYPFLFSCFYHNSQIQNIFNSTCTINQQSNTGYFMLGYNSNDLFNDNIIVTSSGSGGIYIGFNSGTGSPTLAAGKTITVGGAGFSAGFLALGGFIQLGNAVGINLNMTGTAAFYIYKTTANCIFNAPFNVTAPDVWIEGGTFNSTAVFTKTAGTSNHNNQVQNIFNASCTINQQSNTGYFMLGYNSNDLFNDSIIVSSTGSGGIMLGYQAGNGTPTLASGKTIKVGSAGFNAGYLNLNTFTQLGNAPINLTFTGTNTSLSFARNTLIGGALTATVPSIYFSGATFNGNVNVTKTGTTSDNSSGSNIFNAATTITNNGSGYILLGNGNADQFNASTTFNNAGSSYIYVAYNSSNNIFASPVSFNNTPTNNLGAIYVSWLSAGTLFNDNVVVTSTNGQGVQFCGSTSASATLAATRTITIGAGGFSAGLLSLKQFTQVGNTPQTLNLTGTAQLYFGSTATFNGDIVTSSPSIFFNGGTFNRTVNAIKTGATNDASPGGNTFNSTFTITNTGSGYFLMGNGNPDVFNASATFNNQSSGQNMYVAYNSTGNIFNGDVIFNNQPTSSGLWIYPNYSGINTQFNGNIIVNNVNGGGIYFGTSVGTATLASGKTISIGSSGFNSGGLIFRNFTQVGTTAQTLTATGTGYIQFSSPNTTFNGTVTTASPGIFFNGATFNADVIAAKNGSTNDASSGGNTFNGSFNITNTGAGYFLMGNGNPDVFNGSATFNNQSSGQHMYSAYNSTGNIFNGDVTFNNQPASSGLWIYPNYMGINTQFNGNIIINNVNAGGIYFGPSTGTATLASGKTISIGGNGFNSGGLIFRNFTQIGTTAQTLGTTGTSYIQFSSPNTTFNGAITTTSPGLFFNGAIFNGTINSTKNGVTNDASTGANIFNAASTFTNNGTGYLLMTNGTADTYNSDVTFVQSNTGPVYPNYNNNSNYNGNLTITSPSSTAITFGAGNGTATFAGISAQNINATTGTPAPIFTRLVMNNTNGGVTLNSTPINVSTSLIFTSGLLTTTTTNILTMLNASTVAVGNALSTSYVNGPMRYQKSSSGASTLNFPVGNWKECRPIALTVSHSSGTLYNYQTQFYNSSAAALNYTLPATVNKVSIQHYYTINRTDASNTSQPSTGLSGNQVIQIFFGTDDGVSDGSKLTIVKNIYTTPTKWYDIGGMGAPAYNNGNPLVGSVTSTSVPTAFNSFSTFALANDNGGVNVLPIELLFFNAKKNDNKVDLIWSTATETNNNYFDVEKSNDGENFVSLTNVPSQAPQGNSRITLNYVTTDSMPFVGYNYYRLKQFNMDGTFEYSPIVAIEFTGSGAADEDEKVELLNSLTAPTLRITTPASWGNSVYTLEMYNDAGQLMKQAEKITVDGGSSEVKDVDLGGMAHGIYVAVLSNTTQKRKKSFKIVK